MSIDRTTHRMGHELDLATVWNAYERLVPEFTHPIEYNEHIARYRFAAHFTSDRNVLDLGCGVGYGTATLCNVAARIVGVDVCWSALMYAKSRYLSRNQALLNADACNIPLATATMDVVISFEVFEHISNKHLYLSEIRRVLIPGGVALLSTPHRGAKHQNQHHAEELSLEEFDAVLRQHFSGVELYGQAASAMVKEKTKRWNRPRRIVDRIDALNVRAAL